MAAILAAALRSLARLRWNVIQLAVNMAVLVSCDQATRRLVGCRTLRGRQARLSSLETGPAATHLPLHAIFHVQASLQLETVKLNCLNFIVKHENIIESTVFLVETTTPCFWLAELRSASP